MWRGSFPILSLPITGGTKVPVNISQFFYVQSCSWLHEYTLIIQKYTTFLLREDETGTEYEYEYEYEYENMNSER
jgi:hypothetical protein